MRCISVKRTYCSVAVRNPREGQSYSCILYREMFMDHFLLSCFLLAFCRRTASRLSNGHMPGRTGHRHSAQPTAHRHRARRIGACRISRTNHQAPQWQCAALLCTKGSKARATRPRRHTITTNDLERHQPPSTNHQCAAIVHRRCDTAAREHET